MAHLTATFPSRTHIMPTRRRPLVVRDTFAIIAVVLSIVLLTAAFWKSFNEHEVGADDPSLIEPFGP